MTDVLYFNLIKRRRLTIYYCTNLYFQTVLLQNLYLNPQNAALTADGSHSMFLSLLCVSVIVKEKVVSLVIVLCRLLISIYIVGLEFHFF